MLLNRQGDDLRALENRTNSPARSRIQSPVCGKKYKIAAIQQWA